jgi:DNA-binding MarR family transcriptional regulator
MKSSRALESALPGHLNHGKMMKLLGYHLAQAGIPSNKIFDKHIGSEFSLKRVEFTILMLVWSNQQVTPKSLSQALGIPAPNLTLILDRLEGRALILRSRSETDRRVQYVNLTPQGLDLVVKADALSDTMEQELLKHLTEAERGMLFELLKKVAIHRNV